MFKLGEILRENKDRYTRDMTREMGKVVKEPARCSGGDRLHVLHRGRGPQAARLYDAGRNAK